MELFTGLETGRPASTEGRLAKEIHVYDLLDSLGIAYSRVDHEAAATMEDCLVVDETLGVAMCKNLYLCNRQKTDFYLLLMPGDKPFKTKELSGQLGVSRLSFAEAFQQCLIFRLISVFMAAAIRNLGTRRNRGCILAAGFRFRMVVFGLFFHEIPSFKVWRAQGAARCRQHRRN